MYQPAPEEDEPPTVFLCRVQRPGDSTDWTYCNRRTDGDRTILGYPICSDCYHALTYLEADVA